MAKKNNSSLQKSNEDFIEFDYTDKHQADNKYVSKRKAKKILNSGKSPLGGTPNHEILHRELKSSIRPTFQIDFEHDDYDLGDFENSK